MGEDENNSNSKIILGLLGLIGITSSIAVFAVSVGLQIYPLILAPMSLLPLSVYALTKYNKGLIEKSEEKVLQIENNLRKP